MYFIYIITNKANTTLYIGVTNNLIRRISEHRSKLVDGFSKRYKLTKLVYYEQYTTAYDAIAREKQLKGWSRAKKVDLIRSINPAWNDLFDALLG